MTKDTCPRCGEDTFPQSETGVPCHYSTFGPACPKEG